MALDKNTAGLIFRLDADSKPAITDLNSFKEFMGGLLEGIKAEAKEQFSRIRTEVKGIGDEAEKAKKPTKDLFESLNIKGDLERQLRNIAGGFGGIGDAAVGAISGAGGLALGLGAVVAGLVSAGFKTAEYAGHLSDLAAKSNLSTDTLQTLNLAATLTGQSLEQVAQTAVIFQKKMDDANAGSKELRSVFNALGVDLKGPVDGAFRQAVESLSQMEDGSRKTAIALELFGRGGSALLPILAQVGGSFEALESRARELGIVLSKEDVEAADAFGDSIDLLKLQLNGLVNQIGTKVIPVLTGLAATARSALRDTKGFITDLIKDIGSTGNIGFNVAARVAGDLATDKALQDAAEKGKKELAAPARVPKGGSKTASDPASEARLRQLQIQLQEEERVNRSAREAIKRIYDQRAIDENEFASQLIAQAQDRLSKELAILDQEKKVAESAKFSPDKKKTELDRISAARADLERGTADEIERINDDLRRRLTQSGIAFEQAQAQAESAALKRRAARITAALQDNIISNEDAERQLTEITQKGIENRLALANAEVERAGENTQLKAVALEKVKALEIELAAAVEEAQRRILEAQRRDLANLRAYLEARNKLYEDIQTGEVTALDRQAAELERRAGRGRPELRPAAIQARRDALIAESDHQSRLNQIRIDAETRAAVDAGATQEQKLAAAKLGNQLSEQEEQRHQDEINRILRESKEQQELNDPLSARSFIGNNFADRFKETGSVIEGIKGSINGVLQSLDAMKVSLEDMASGALSQFIGGMGDLVKQFVLTGETGPAALRKLTAAVLANFAAQAAVNALVELAKGFGTLFTNPAEAGAHFTSAALWGAVAGVSAIAGRAIAPKGDPAGAGGGAGNPSTQSGNGTRTIEQGGPLHPRQEQIVIHLHGELRDGVLQVVHQDYTNSGPTRSLIRRDILGEG